MITAYVKCYEDYNQVDVMTSNGRYIFYIALKEGFFEP